MATLVKRNGVSLPTLVNDFFDGDLFDLGGDFLKRGAKFNPSVNVSETDKDFKIEVAAPGLEKKDFKVEVDSGILTISAEKEEETKEEKKNYSRREFSYNKFSRSFQVPDNSMPEKIDAKYENGILNIVLPKKEVTLSKAKKEIKVA